MTTSPDAGKTDNLPFMPGADSAKMKQIAPLVRERIKLLSDVRTVADFFFVAKLAPYDPAELIPQKGDRALALREGLVHAAANCRLAIRLCRKPITAPRTLALKRSHAVGLLTIDAR